MLRLHWPARGRSGPAEVAYEVDYAVTVRHDPPERADRAVSWLHPVSFVSYFTDRWPRFLDDLLPGGAARTWWIRHLGLRDAAESEIDGTLLRDHTIAPIGNVRVGVAPAGESSSRRFHVEDIVEREPTFLDTAYQAGVSIGGATGAGGEAPKLLLRRSADDEVWIDTDQQDAGPDAWVLVKFARNKRTRLDANILRAEAAYYRVLAELGLDTVPIEGLEIRESKDSTIGPSLWMRRFDVARDGEGTVVRLGVESVYSIMDRAPGSRLSYWEVLDALERVLCEQPGGIPFADLAFEVLRRDLLHVLLGNTDNHGRNMAILRTPDGCRLAPMYDVAPMRLDSEMIVRTSRWPGDENAGAPDFRQIVRRFDTRLDVDVLWERLCAFSSQLVPLRRLLLEAGAPLQIVDARPLALDTIPTQLKNWGLLS